MVSFPKNITKRKKLISNPKIVVRIRSAYPKFKECLKGIYCDDILSEIWKYFYDSVEQLRTMNKFIKDDRFELDYDVKEYMRLKNIVGKRVIYLR